MEQETESIFPLVPIPVNKKENRCLYDVNSDKSN